MVKYSQCRHCGEITKYIETDAGAFVDLGHIKLTENEQLIARIKGEWQTFKFICTKVDCEYKRDIK